MTPKPVLPITRLGTGLVVLGMIFYGLPSCCLHSLRWWWRAITHRLPYIDVPGPPPGSAS